MYSPTVLLATLLASLQATSAAPTANYTDHSIGFIGCSMSENVAQGYSADNGKRM